MDGKLLIHIIENFQLGIWRYLRALGCDASTADDLCQDTFLEILKRPFTVCEDKATAAYLRRVAFHKFISHHRHYDRWVVMENIEKFEKCWIKYVQDDTGNEMIKVLTECLSLLPNRAQLALKMLYHDRATRNEIAAALEITPDGAKNVLQRAKTKLKKMIEERIPQCCCPD